MMPAPIPHPRLRQRLSPLPRQMGVPANTGPVLNVGPAAAAAEQQLNPPRSFDVVWSLNHADDVGE